MTGQHWQSQFDLELQRAESARLSGNEGRARVCARRAVGVAIREYYRRSGEDLPGASAYNHLRRLVEEDRLPPQVRQVAGHFLVRINEEHALPIPADLLAEARWLARQLLEEKDG
jgi:hypothetical protein